MSSRFAYRPLIAFLLALAAAAGVPGTGGVCEKPSATIVKVRAERRSEPRRTLEPFWHESAAAPHAAVGAPAWGRDPKPATAFIQGKLFQRPPPVVSLG